MTHLIDTAAAENNSLGERVRRVLTTPPAIPAEGERLYAVLNVRGGVPEFRYVEDALLAARDPLLPAWLDVRLNRLCRALSGMERGSDSASEAEAARAAIARLLKCKEAVQ